MKSVPIACTLSATQLQERKATTLAQLLATVETMKRLDAGYAFRFSVSDALLSQLVRVIQQERQCCRFMQFELKVEADGGPVWLTITGPDGTKVFLDDLLGLS